jgi:four helix bundle protein
MARIEWFEDLEIWKEAVAIGVDIYNLTSKGKLQNDFSIRDQLRRAAISISNNIAEGFEYNNNKVFIKFLGYAKASAGELRSNLLFFMPPMFYRMARLKCLSINYCWCRKT